MYTIDRIETVPNRKGIDEIFVKITITDELGIYNFGHWLNPNEYTLYLDGQLESVIEALLPRAKQNRIAELEAIARQVEIEEI